MAGSPVWAKEGIGSEKDSAKLTIVADVSSFVIGARMGDRCLSPRLMLAGLGGSEMDVPLLAKVHGSIDSRLNGKYYCSRSHCHSFRMDGRIASRSSGHHVDSFAFEQEVEGNVRVGIEGDLEEGSVGWIGMDDA